MSFIQELKRRNVLRIGLAYAISAWVLIQVMEIATDAFEAPPWVLKIVITLLVIGAIPTLLFSWVFEMTPEGLRKESDLDPSAERQTTGKLNVAVIVLLVIAIGLFLSQRFLPDSEKGSGSFSSSSSLENEPDPFSAQSRAPLGSKSIAVLPFENFSGSQDDAHFSDGLADTVLHRLAQIDDLTVIARNSSFVYKGGNVDIRKVGEELGVANVLEGSVQRQGDRLRVIAQLIETASGTHLWSETYDRSLSDIFSIQDEIATAVAEALQVELLGDEAERLTRTGTDDAAAWALYLAAKEIVDAFDWERLDEARELLVQAIGRDPEFVEAYQSLALYYNATAWAAPNPTVREAALQNGFEAVNRAIALDPDNPENLRLLGSMRRRNYQTLEAIALLEAYVVTNPNDAGSHMQLGLAQHNAGLFRAAYESFSEARRLNPKAAITYRQLGFTSAALRDFEESLRWYRQGAEVSDWGVFHTDPAHRVYMRVLGQWDEALAALALHSFDEGRGAYERLMQLLVSVGLYDRASQLIEIAEEALGDPPFAARLQLMLSLHEDGSLEDTTLEAAAAGGMFNRSDEFAAWGCLGRRDYDCVLAVLRPRGESFESSFSEIPFVGTNGDLDVAAWLGLAELRAGDESRGRRLLTAVLKRALADVKAGEIGCYPSFCNQLAIAELKAALGDREGALEALRASLPDASDAYLRTGLLPDVPIERSAYLESIQDDPGFAAFVKEMRRRESLTGQRLTPKVDDVLARLADDVPTRMEARARP